MTEKQKISVIYHSIFSYSLTKTELVKWEAGKKLSIKHQVLGVKYKNVPIRNTKYLIHNRAKLLIAHSASNLLSKIPTVLFVGITGSLAMNNAKPQSDIDLMIITKANTLWFTRILVYFLLITSHISFREPKNKNEKDKVCLNFWIDETKLSWSGPKNAYIAHEIAQVVPLLNKNEVYSRWLSLNDWVLSYWPNAVDSKYKVSGIKNYSSSKSFTHLILNTIYTILNYIAYFLQRIYMSPKLTRETTTPHSAFFHPYDWGERVSKELVKRGVISL